jgi:hypothetical protein
MYYVLTTRIWRVKYQEEIIYDVYSKGRWIFSPGIQKITDLESRMEVIGFIFALKILSKVF